jgi:hypothetical protein
VTAADDFTEAWRTLIDTQTGLAILAEGRVYLEGLDDDAALAALEGFVKHGLDIRARAQFGLVIRTPTASRDALVSELSEDDPIDHWLALGLLNLMRPGASDRLNL